MTCPRCQGLVVTEPTVTRCLNCGYRPIVAYVPAMGERMDVAREAEAYDKMSRAEIRRLAREAFKPRGKDRQKRRAHV